MVYSKDFALIMLERKLARQLGHRSEDELAELHERIAQMTGSLDGILAEVSLLQGQLRHVEDNLGEFPLIFRVPDDSACALHGLVAGQGYHCGGHSGSWSTFDIETMHSMKSVTPTQPHLAYVQGIIVTEECLLCSADPAAQQAAADRETAHAGWHQTAPHPEQHQPASPECAHKGVLRCTQCCEGPWPALSASISPGQMRHGNVLNFVSLHACP